MGSFLKILIPNKITPSRYKLVLEKMRKLGSPVIEVIEISNGVYFALEGSHRTTAAKELGLTPVLNIITKANFKEPEFKSVYIQAEIRKKKGLEIIF
jgi:hypothetical protein